MDNVSLEKIYSVIGELYLNSRIRVTELEKSLEQANSTTKSASDKVNQLLAEISHYQMANDKLPK